MKSLFFISLLFLFFSCKDSNWSIIKKETEYKLTDQQVAYFKQSVEDEELSDQIAFLLDFTLSSNKERFFVVDLKRDSILTRGLVTHGSCTGSMAQPGDQYSNVESSYCSSLGRYKIGHSYQGKFGLAYKLHGLDHSNSNAFERFIVLHAHDCVPDKPVDYSICLSQGCPTVSPHFLETLAPLIDHSKKEILLWIVDEGNS